MLYQRWALQEKGRKRFISQTRGRGTRERHRLQRWQSTESVTHLERDAEAEEEANRQTEQRRCSDLKHEHSNGLR